MPVRVQNLNGAFGLGKQTDIFTASAAYLRFTKLNAAVYFIDLQTEDDAPEIGKGNEFISANGVFKTAQDFKGVIEKYASAEFTTWAWAYALGNVGYNAGIYTITPQDPTVGATGLELPYFTTVQQLNEAGSPAIDELYYGCAIEEVTTTFNYQPGRQSARTTANFWGSGKYLTPSAVTMPAVQADHYMLSQSMAASINGVDYVAGKGLMSGTMSWKNNFIPTGYFPGAGLQNGAAIRGRIEMGARVPTFNFRARLFNNSAEFADLIAQTTGTATLTLTYDSTHTVTWQFPLVSYKARQISEDNGIVTVDVTVAPRFHATNGVLTVTAQCGIVGIAQ